MFVKLEILLFKVEVERNEGAGVSTNPFVTVPCSTPKKKIKLKPKHLVFKSPESTLLSPSYVTVCSPISAAVHSVAGPCSLGGGNDEEQNLSLLHSRRLLQPAEDLISPVGPGVPLPSTSTNPFLSFSSTVPVPVLLPVVARALIMEAWEGPLVCLRMILEQDPNLQLCPLHLC